VWICDCGAFIETPCNTFLLPRVACNRCGEPLDCDWESVLMAMADPVWGIQKHRFAQCLN
jgi:hypothetical protein